MDGLRIRELRHGGHPAGRRPHVIVRRLGGTLAARQELVALRIEDAFHHFVMIVVAAEEALGLLRDQVVAVEERMVAGGRRAQARQEDVVAILKQRAARRRQPFRADVPGSL